MCLHKVSGTDRQSVNPRREPENRPVSRLRSSCSSVCELWALHCRPGWHYTHEPPAGRLTEVKAAGSLLVLLCERHSALARGPAESGTHPSRHPRSHLLLL